MNPMLRALFWMALGGTIASSAWILALAIQKDRERTAPRIVGFVEPGADTILGCPLSKSRIEEWARMCRARARLEAIGRK